MHGARAARRNLIGMARRTLTGHISDHELNVIEVEEIWVDATTPPHKRIDGRKGEPHGRAASLPHSPRRPRRRVTCFAASNVQSMTYIKVSEIGGRRTEQ